MSGDTICSLVEIEEDVATPDEVEAIREARQEIERGEFFSNEEVWA